MTSVFQGDPVEAAHEFELDDVSTEEMVDTLAAWNDGREDAPSELQEEMAVRHLLMRFRKLEREEERLSALVEELARPYLDEIARARAAEGAIRDVLREFLIRREVNSLKFPGLYTPTLSTKAKGGKAKAEDPVLIAAELLNDGLDVPYKPSVVDAAAALELLLTHRGLKATPTGLLVSPDGEVVDVPGVEVEPETKTIQLRRA